MTGTPNDASATPVWVPYSPEDVAIGEFGWLWLDGPMGEEWVLIRTEDDEDGPFCDLLGRMDEDGCRDTLQAEEAEGTPYLSLSQPTVEPGKCDALEVAIRFAPGASATHAFGQDARVEAIKAALWEVLATGRGDND